MRISDFKKKQLRNGFKNVSELRQDLVSGDWMVVATGRAKRPASFRKKRQKKIRAADFSVSIRKSAGQWS